MYFRLEYLNLRDKIKNIKQYNFIIPTAVIIMDSQNGTSANPGTEEVQSRRLAEDYFYSETHQERELKDSSIPSALAKYNWCAGFDSLKKNNLHVLSSEHILFAIGCTYHIYNTDTQEDKIFFSRDGDGIGALAVHPTRSYYAVGEKGTYPNVYIYEYPSNKLYRILRKGTEKVFSCISWSASGKLIATVGSSPDYMLTVWDWLDEKVVLKSKAFGQEVYKVTFSPKFEQEITTSGTAHIRFWRMAKTFTGLKLQGDIGKFGQVELSDICGYVELPDGKVLSGSEYGNLILWEGTLIKAVITVDKENSPCHKGSIECILIDGDEIMSTGTDGFIRWWDINEIMQADPEEGYYSPVSPKHQVLIGEHSEINNLVRGDKTWFAVDRKGKIWKISGDFLEQNVLMDFHSGKIMDAAVSAECNALVTIGEDGSTRLWDFINHKEIYSSSWSGKGMCVSWAARTGYNQDKVIAAGFDNGLVRLLYLGPSAFELLLSLKAHDSAVTKIKFARNGKYLATVGSDNTVFFFDIGENSALEPIVITPVSSKINSLEWNINSDKVLLALQSGSVVEIAKPEKDTFDTGHSFEVVLPQKEWKIKMMEFQRKKHVDDDLAPLKRPGEAPVVEEEWPLASIFFAVYYNSLDKFIISADAPYNEYLYICEFTSLRPLKAIQTSPSFCQSLFITQTILISSHNNGTYQVYSLENPERSMVVKKHDSGTKIKKAFTNSKETYAISIGEDSTIFITELFTKEILQSAKTGISVKANNEPKYELGIEILKIDEKPPSITPLSDDITDTSIYSLQMDKLKTDEDKKKTLAEMKKERKKQEIAVLRAEFEDLLRENQSLEPKYHLSNEELQVDPAYTNTLLSRNQLLIEEAEKEIAWYTEYYKISLEKYKKYFLDNLAIERFKVRSLSSDNFVTSFRVTKASDFLVSNLSQIQAFLEEEGRIKQGSMMSETESLVSPGKFSQNTVEQSEFHEETKAEFKITSQQVKKDGKKKSKAQEEREKRSRLREERKIKIDAKKRQEPSSDTKDPMDERDIETAKATMGDFKLKTSPDYVVPKSLCVNASQKRRQMFLLMESSHNLKMELNSRLLALRENKSRLIEWIKEQNKVIFEINKELGVQESLFEPHFQDDEWPEDYYKVTDEDLDEYSSTKALKAPPKVQEIEDHTASREKARRKQKPLTEAEKQFKAHRDLKLLNEKKHLQEEINKRIQHFDEALRQQQEQKYLLESDLKQIDMKLITFYQELNLLDNMEPEDQRLTSKIEKLNEDKQVLLLEIANINKEYEVHQQEQEEITQKHKDIYTQFNNMVGGSNFAKELQAVLDRNIKRKKKKKNKESEGEEDEEDESDEESEDSEDESDEDDDQNLDLCPNDCDMNLFEEVVNLREARLDLVDRSNNKKATINDLKKKQEDVEKKEKNISKAIQKTEQEIQEFQTDKMQKLNQILISIILSQDQIQIMDGNRLPADLDYYVLFTNNEFDKLRNRIVELKKEKEAEDFRKGDLEKEMKKLEKNCKKHEKRKEEEKKKFEAVQALRFGHAIKLENLKYAEPSDQLAKLKNDFNKSERESVKKIEEAKSELAECREKFREVTKKNTMLLEARSKLFESIMKKNKQLDFGNKEIFKEEEDSKQGNITQEQLSLQSVMNLQKAKIAELKTEISLFRRKGGHIYTKITANRRANMS
jgi:cilia- and flagella-associated protein 44